MTSQISPHLWFPEPSLSFHPDHVGDTDIHPLRGLLRFGPYSAGLVPDPIRVATISPSGESQRLYDFMKALNSKFDPTERKDYLPPWPGFRSVFNLNMRAAEKPCHIQLDERLEPEMAGSSTPHIILSSRLIRALQTLDGMRERFDVIFIYVPQSWSAGFFGNTDEDFDLHDHLKAASAVRRLPIQLVREDRALAYPHKASVMWRIGLALYEVPLVF